MPQPLSIADLIDCYMISDDGMWASVTSLFDGPFSGVYRLHALGEDGEFIFIPRLLAPDPNGVLYIGASSVVANRLGSMRKSISAAYRLLDPDGYGALPYSDPSPHQTGRKIVRIGRRFIERFRFDRLCVTLERHVGMAEATGADYGYYTREDVLLRAYEQEFGERPALNG